jgi:hypothetical protein
VTRVRIDRHPEYPFRAGREESLQAKGIGFLGAPAEHSRQDKLVREFVVLAHRYAFLERLVQGDILYQIPVHAEVFHGYDPTCPEEQGEILAARERELLDWSGSDAGGLAEALDAIGIKLLFLAEEPTSSEGLSSSAMGDGLCGAFYFDGEVGPAFLVGSPPGRPESTFVLAHTFAHLAADVDPYAARFCRWNLDTLENMSKTPEETRADQFARALLVPEDRLRLALSQLGEEVPMGQVDPRWEQLSTLFEVPAALLSRRLQDLALPSLGCSPVPQPPEPALAVEGDLIGLPERFVNLALAAYCERVLETSDLARFLRTTEPEVLGVLAWAGIQQRKASGDDVDPDQIPQ